jgi:GntR family transcriptional regulator / MocR family aminotransferase
MIPGQGLQRAFRVGLPAIDAFPGKTWQQLLVRSWHQMQHDLLAHHHAAGYMPLREAIASYLTTARGVRCTAEQVIIVNGSQQGIDLATRVLLDPGDDVWFLSRSPWQLLFKRAICRIGENLICYVT